MSINVNLNYIIITCSIHINKVLDDTLWSSLSCTLYMCLMVIFLTIVALQKEVGK